MTINSVDLSWSRCSGTAESNQGLNYSVSFIEGWQITHSADATDVEILSADGLPALRACHPSVPIACNRIGPLQRLGPIFSIVMVEYYGELGPGGLLDSPINKVPEYTWSDVTYTELVDEDAGGEPIVTENDEPINGVTKEFCDQTLTITRNFGFINPFTIHAYRQSVNSDTFAGYPAGTARLVGYTATSVKAACYVYWRVNAKVQFRLPYRTTNERAWCKRVLHQGYKVRIPIIQSTHVVGSEVVNAIDAYRAPSNKPVLLDEDGYLLAADAAPVWLEWELYDPLPYSGLGLL